jgi:nucleoid DNA-binding protein
MKTIRGEMKKQNCWEYQNCGKQSLTDDIFEEVGTCPASTERCLDGINEGRNGGRSCWGIAGTLCGGEVQGSIACKIETCRKCGFYQLVQMEEGNHFVTGSELVEMLLYREAILRDRENDGLSPTMVHPLPNSLDNATRPPRPEKPMTQIKSDIAGRIKDNTALDKQQANTITDQIIDIIKSSLAAGDTIQISGFGNFKVRRKSARPGRNPKTLQTYLITARKVVTFSASKLFRRELNH